MEKMRLVVMSDLNMNPRRKFDPNALTKRNVLVLVPSIIGILALFILFASLVNHETYIKLGGLILTTAVLYGVFIGTSRSFFHMWKFLAFTVAALIVHLTAFTIVLAHVDDWKLTWFTVMVVEYPVLAALRDQCRRDPN
jgi:hypothetical protein